jgi:hypothetical protein
VGYFLIENTFQRDDISPKVAEVGRDLVSRRYISPRVEEEP